MTIEQFRCPNWDMWYEVTRGQISGPTQAGTALSAPFVMPKCIAGLALIA